MKSRFKGFLQSVHEFWGSNRDYSDDSGWPLAAIFDRCRKVEAVLKRPRGLLGASFRVPPAAGRAAGRPREEGFASPNARDSRAQKRIL